MRRHRDYQRRRLNSAAWFDVRSHKQWAYLCLREAVFTLGAHQFLIDRNVAFRIQLSTMSDAEVAALGARIIRVWPARNIRP